MKILVVDDSMVVRKLVGTMLEAKDYEVFFAENGQVGLEKLTGGEIFDFILLDWNMPVMDGPTFLEEKRKQNIDHSPVIMMTTEDSMECIERALSLGAEEYIMKPFTVEVILDKMNMVQKAG